MKPQPQTINVYVSASTRGTTNLQGSFHSFQQVKLLKRAEKKTTFVYADIQIATHDDIIDG